VLIPFEIESSTEKHLGIGSKIIESLVTFVSFCKKLIDNGVESYYLPDVGQFRPN